MGDSTQMMNYRQAICAIVGIVISCAISVSSVQADDKGAWTTTDTVLQATYLTLHGMDWAQTLHIARNPDKYYETNKILGEHPSQGRVNSYFLLTGLAHTGIAGLLDKPWRTGWQLTGIYIGYDSVRHNREYGIGISFHF
jgi:hypothetical protein